MYSHEFYPAFRQQPFFVCVCFLGWWIKPGPHGGGAPAAARRFGSPWHHPHARLVWGARSGLLYRVRETAAVPGPIRLYHRPWCRRWTACTKVQPKKKKNSTRRATQLTLWNLSNYRNWIHCVLLCQVFEAGGRGDSVLPLEGNRPSGHQRREHSTGHAYRRCQDHWLWIWCSAEGHGLHRLWR